MARGQQSLYALNRGVISRLGLARMDLKRLAMAAEMQTNWMPRVLGSMMLRPGFGYLGATLGNQACRLVRFIFGTTDTSLLEFTPGFMRVWINDVLLTRPAVSTTITNGTFAVDLSGWTDSDESPAGSSWVSPNYMQLVGSGSSRAIREQHVTVISSGVEHALRITIARGPVSLRVGSSSGSDDYVSETTLYEGTHSIAFTPTGDFYVRFFSRLTQVVWVSGCTLESSGVVQIPTPWGASDIANLRTDQSADVVFVACSGYQQRRIERRGTRPAARSWSVALYAPTNGPFQLLNLTTTAMTASGLNGNITLTSSIPYFKTGHVGALFSVTSTGQEVSRVASANGEATASIRVIGLSSGSGARTFSYSVSGNATASSIDLQRSYDNSTWASVGGTDWPTTTDTSGAYDDGLNNQIIYYRLIMVTRGGADNVTLRLIIGSGSIRGVARVTGFTNSTVVDAEVVVDMGGTTAVTTWQEGHWSDVKGWPTAVRIHEGRMWWSGQNGIWGSISDAYDSFDETFLGDAGPINRTVGSGPVDTINWLLSLKGLVLGAQGSEYTARASSLDEPLTPTNFNLKVSSTQGSGPGEAIKVDQLGYFVNRSLCKVFEIAFDVRAYDYQSTNLMELAPEIGLSGIARINVQRLPDTRVHCVLENGTAVVAVMNKTEEVLALIPVETDGLIEDVEVLPSISGDMDDQVYYVVKRIVGGLTVRYLEKWAQELDCRGDKQLCKLADSFVTYSGAPATSIPVAHLEGEEVVVWADGRDVGTIETTTPWTQRYTVTGGVVTLNTAASNVVVGLGYQSQFKSSKLGFQIQGSSPLNQQKRNVHIGLILADTYRLGVKFGADLTHLDDMPLMEDGIDVPQGTATSYDQNLIEFPGLWTTDVRICLQAQAPRPCTVLAVTLDLEQNS